MTGTTSDTMPTGTMAGTSQLLLAHHLKQLKLPTVLREYEKVARECAQGGIDHPRYLLRLMEAMPQEIVTFAVTEAIRLGAIGFDAVKLIALARIERRPARLDLVAYPHLPRMDVKTTSAADYAVLLPRMAA